MTTEQQKRARANTINGTTTMVGSLPTTLSYPSSLENGGDTYNTHAAFLSFTAYKDILVVKADRSTLFGENTKKNTQTQHMVGQANLPMVNVSSSYSHSYDSESGSGAVSKIIQAYSGAQEGQKLGAAVGSLLNSVIGGSEALSEILHDDVGIVLDKKIFSRYQQTNMRTAEFSYILTATNKEELLTIAYLLLFFRIHSAASLTNYDVNFLPSFKEGSLLSGISNQVATGVNNFFEGAANSQKLKIPSLWSIEEIPIRNNPGDERIIQPYRFGPAFCTEVSYDTKGTENFPLTFLSGDPVVINLSIKFVETLPLYAEDIMRNGF